MCRYEGSVCSQALPVVHVAVHISETALESATALLMWLAPILSRYVSPVVNIAESFISVGKTYNAWYPRRTEKMLTLRAEPYKCMYLLSPLPPREGSRPEDPKAR